MLFGRSDGGRNPGGRAYLEYNMMKWHENGRSTKTAEVMFPLSCGKLQGDDIYIV